MNIRILQKKLRTFCADRSGTALVEFAIALPLLLLIIGTIIEGSRIAVIHQSTAAGVRDAARLIARVAPDDYCTNSSTSVPSFNTEASKIVMDRYRRPGERVLPSGVNVIGVEAVLGCVDVDYSDDDVPMVFVIATIQISFPFGGAFKFFCSEEPCGLDPLTAVVSDQSRVFGI